MYEHQRILKENFRSIKEKVTFHVGKATSYRGFIAIAAYLCARRIVEIVDCACLRREADAHLIYLAFVGCVGRGIAFFLYLLQGELGSGVELELEDIYIVGTFKYAVNTPLACLLLYICIVFAKQHIPLLTSSLGKSRRYTSNSRSYPLMVR